MSKRIARSIWAAGLVLAALASPGRAPAGEGPKGPVYWIPIDDGPQVMPGMIERWSAIFVSRNVESAKKAGASLIVFAIKTYGGDVKAAIAVTNAISSARPVPTVAYVEDRAISAGALIALACDRIYMEEGSTMGAAQAIILTPEGGPKPAGEKFDTVMRARFRAEAERRAARAQYGEGVLAIAEAMTDPDVAVRRVQVDGQETFVRESMLSEFERKREEEGKTVAVLEEVVPAGKLLTMTAKEAFEKFRFVDGVVADRDELLRVLGYEGSQVVVPEVTWAHEIARFLGGMAISGLLISVAMLGLLMELWSPGKGIGGLIFLFAIGLFFWSHAFAGDAGAVEIVLFLIGVGFLGVEAFVIPGFGAFGFLGIAFVVGSLVLSLLPGTIVSPGIEGAPFPWDRLRSSVLTVFGSLGIAAVGLLVLARYVPRIPLFKHLVLAVEGAAGGSTGVGAAVAPGLERFVGKRGVAATDLRPSGKVEVEGDPVDAVTEAEFIEKGQPVKVLEVSGYRVVVAHARDGGGP